MNKVKFGDSSDLIKSLLTDLRRDRTIAFLLGSAVSVERGIGVPGVDSMLLIIKEYLSEIGSFDQEAESIISQGGTDSYQKIYDYMFRTGCDQDDIRTLMNRFMACAKNKNDGTWILSTGLIELAIFIKNNNVKINNILTTNFDPLIEEALKGINKNILTHSLDQDTNIDSVLNINSENLNVLHLHGYYTQDTMHTTSQLEGIRKKVQNSIENILSTTKNLYVFGYGGWQDVFIVALEEIVNKYNANYNIRWAFFSDSEFEIAGKNERLLKLVAPAIHKAKFHVYKGINFHEFFTHLNEAIKAQNTLSFSENLTKKTEDTDVHKVTLRDIYKGNAKNIDDRPKIKEFNLPYDSNHDLIRLFEQSTADEFLEMDHGFILESSWGYGKFGFLSSIIHSNENKKLILRVDFDGIFTRRKAEEKVITDIGYDLSALFAQTQCIPTFILLDNIDDPDPSLLVYLNEISSLTKENTLGINVIFITNKSLNLNVKKIALNQLQVDDIKEYLSLKSEHNNLQPGQIDKLYVLTSGMPVKLDKLQEFQTVLPLSEILDEETIDISEDSIIENVPPTFLVKLKELYTSEDIDNKRLCTLLNILAILECGESAKNIRRYFSEYKFQIEDFTKIANLNLVKPYTKSDDYGEIKILRLNPVIREFVTSRIDDNEKLRITITGISLLFGDKWESANVKLNNTAKTMLLYQDFFPGNAHISILWLLKFKIAIKDESYIIKIVNLAISFCMYLKKISRFKELYSFSGAVYALINKMDTPKRYDILYYYTEGARMIDDDQATISLLSDFFAKEHDKKVISNDLYKNLLLTYVHALSSTEHKHVYEMASKLYEISPKGSGYKFTAEYILVLQSNNRRHKISNLKRIEKEARDSGRERVANNICLELSELLESGQNRYFISVLESEDNSYTRIRALLAQAKKLLSEGNDEIITKGYLTSLMDAYKYLFLQRIALFNRCHALIWEVFEKYGRYDDLYKLYRTSSILWRLNGDSERELRYANILRKYSDSKNNIEYEYVAFVERRHDFLIKTSAKPARIDDM